MLLIALTGPVGSGKTSRIRELVDRLRADGREVEGFLATAGERTEPGKGAISYDLEFLATGERVRFADRTESTDPNRRYVFSEVAQQKVASWAESIAPSDVLVMDEFGPLEAAGEGHFAAWPSVLGIDPPIVVIGVRESHLTAIADLLGRPFDLVLSASDPKAVESLAKLAASPKDWERIGIFGGAAGAVEMTLGSALHGARVPLRGQVLSTLQSIVLTYAAEGLARRDRIAWVAVASAGLKALSPAGNRLQPMLAITMQGALYGIALRLFGWNAPAVFVGGFLIGLWAASQTLLLQWLMIGNPVFQVYDKVVKWIANSLGLGDPALPVVLGVVILLSALFSAGATVFFWRKRHAGLEKLMNHARSKRPQTNDGEGWRGALKGAGRDLLRPAFWAPVVVVLILILSGTKWNEAFWTVLRAASVGALLFGVIRLIRVRRLGGWLKSRGLYGPAIAFERAMGEERRG